MEVTLPLCTRKPINKRRRVGYSRSAVQQNAKVGHFKLTERRVRVDRRIKAIQKAPVSLAVSSQVYIYGEEANAILAEEYPIEEQRQTGPWMTDSTFALSQQNSKQWAFVNQIGRKIGNPPVGSFSGGLLFRLR